MLRGGRQMMSVSEDGSGVRAQDEGFRTRPVEDEERPSEDMCCLEEEEFGWLRTKAGSEEPQQEVGSKGVSGGLAWAKAGEEVMA